MAVKATCYQSPATVYARALDCPDDLVLPKVSEALPRSTTGTYPAIFLANLASVAVALVAFAVAIALPATLTTAFAAVGQKLGVVDWVALDWAELVPVCVAGFAAQLVDGAIGMGYGLTSSSVLAAAGLTPATASASVHLAQLGTTFVSGLAHHRHGNVDPSALRRLSPAGSLGALLGALLLASVPVNLAKLASGILLFSLGLAVLFRFLLVVKEDAEATPSAPAKAENAGGQLTPLGFVGGFVDVMGGGGWGPIATSSLLADGRLSPSLVVGTTSASEFFVTVAAVVGFALSSLIGLGGGVGHGARLDMVAALLLGGVVSAPLAPHLTASFRPRVLGVIVGGFICLTNCKNILGAGVSREASRAAHAALLLGWAAAVLHTARAAKGATTSGNTCG